MWPKHIDLKNKINHCTEEAFWPPFPGHLSGAQSLRLLPSPTLPFWNHMDFSAGRRFAIYFGKQGGFSKEPKFATSSFPKAVSGTLTLRHTRRMHFYCSVLGCCFFNSFGLGLFEKGDAVIMPPSFNENFTDSCHMTQASPGTCLCSWEAGLIFFLSGSPTHGQGFSTLRSEAVEASEQTSLPPPK